METSGILLVSLQSNNTVLQTRPKPIEFVATMDGQVIVPFDRFHSDNEIGVIFTHQDEEDTKRLVHTRRG